MRVGCVICSDTFSTFVDVSTIPCGHTFHTYCLLQWIEKSKSCPTCRQKAPSRSVQKLYFDATGTDASQLDPDSLQNQIDSLKFQVVEKTQALKTRNEENAEFKKQTKGLRDEAIKLEKWCKERDTTIAAYKEQLRHFDTLIKNASKAEEEARTLRAQLKLYKRIKCLIEDNSAQIEDTILSNTSDTNSSENIKNLSTISCVLKSRVNRLVEDKRRYADENHSLKARLQETSRATNANKEKVTQLEKECSLQREDLESLERENKSLQSKIRKLQSAIISPSADAKNSALQRLIAESPAPSLDLNRSAAKRESDLTPEITRKVCRLSQHESPVLSRNLTASSRDEVDMSPYLKVKSAPITALNCAPGVLASKTASPKKGGSIFKDGRHASSIQDEFIGVRSRPWASVAPVYEADDFGYDGMGGHHKVDVFPVSAGPGKPPPRHALKKLHKPFKVVNTKGVAPVGAKTILDFFKDPFA